MREENRIDYVEFPAADLDAAKTFYGELFGWTFEDYGADYCAFSDGRLEGGFHRTELSSNADSGAALIVFYARDLEALKARVLDLGGTIKTDIFPFPGGRRFHFLDPNGNELAVWSDR